MTKTKVLIVDDEPAIREVLEMILQEWGYDVRLASDGAEARDLVESYDPEIVISDVVMGIHVEGVSEKPECNADEGKQTGLHENPDSVQTGSWLNKFFCTKKCYRWAHRKDVPGQLRT